MKTSLGPITHLTNRWSSGDAAVDPSLPSNNNAESSLSPQCLIADSGLGIRRSTYLAILASLAAGVLLAREQPTSDSGRSLAVAANPATGPSLAYSPTHSTGDRRLVSQPQHIQNAVSKLSRLQPKRFLQHTGHLDTEGRVVLNSDPIPSVGLLAQESIGSIPEAVHRPADDSKEFWLLDPEKVVPVLVRAIQEQQSTIDAQASRIQVLESQVGILAEDIRKVRDFTADIDGAARNAFAELRAKINQLQCDLDSVRKTADSASSKSSCSCSK